MLDIIAQIIVFNWIPISLMVIGCWIFMEFVKYEHKRLNNK